MRSQTEKADDAKKRKKLSRASQKTAAQADRAIYGDSCRQKMLQQQNNLARTQEFNAMLRARECRKADHELKEIMHIFEGDGGVQSEYNTARKEYHSLLLSKPPELSGIVHVNIKGIGVVKIRDSENDDDKENIN